MIPKLWDSSAAIAGFLLTELITSVRRAIRPQRQVSQRRAGRPDSLADHPCS